MVHRAVTGLLSHASHLVEQHGFSNPEQPRQHQAFFWFSDKNASEQDARLFQYKRSSGQLGRGYDHTGRDTYVTDFEALLQRMWALHCAGDKLAVIHAGANKTAPSSPH